jgi:hypothetical protein
VHCSDPSGHGASGVLEDVPDEQRLRHGASTVVSIAETMFSESDTK